MKGGVRQLFRKEFAEFVRTWRVWVLAGFLLFFALTSPFLAKLTPQIVKAVAVSQPGAIIKLPEPSFRDAYAQWLKNLSQIGAFVVIIIGAGMVAGEVASGTAILALTKPVSRAWFVVIKALTLAAYVVILTIVGTVIVQVGTIIAFGTAPPGELWLGVVGWIMFALALVGLSAFLSALTSTIVAAGIGVIGFFLLAGLGALLRVPVLAWPLVGVAFVAAGAWSFARREL